MDATERSSSLSDHSIRLQALQLTVIDGPDVGLSAQLSGRVIRVGTAKDNELCLTDRTSSRRHFELSLDGLEIVLTDLDSTNGTFVESTRVYRAGIPVGTIVRVGDTSIRVDARESPQHLELSARTEFGELSGSSLAMRELYTLLERVSASDTPVLLHGETGTGKELAAQAIHDESPRASGPFVVVDCGAIPANLFESELFGHERGAFTGANSAREGLLVAAKGGTVFLDEIGELPLELQPKLLRALERRQVRPVGATRPIDLDVRILSATHRNLAAEVNRGGFREDLYFRLAVVRLTMPSLRARRGDVPALVEKFVEALAPERVSEAVAIARQFEHRSFPGNIRELRNAVEEHLLLGRSEARFAGSKPQGSPYAPELFQLSYQAACEQASDEFRREYVQRLLERSGGNISQAARTAGMSRRFLQTLIARHGLSRTKS